MPFVPGTDSSTIAATRSGPSPATTARRWASARSHSSASVVAWNAERYRYGPKNLTEPGMPGSLSWRRASPVTLIAPAVAPW